MRDKYGVRKERTGWRCQAISERHREWGYNCPAVDLDFVVAEYNHGKPVALIEYKDRRYDSANTSNATYQALTSLADGYSAGPIPFFIAVYDPDEWWFVIHPMNDPARKHYAHCVGVPISEQRFVRSIYLLRSSVLAQRDNDAISRLNTIEPA
ncbi:hypothetical protein [Hoeflea sp.]|uniref:hypothetical protein n=1 Tax=Hoeflea sp. TaxID=1940281 RepID=UPI00199AB652|nr:hypothetical protein [Hoeflea sp.]MBC7282615.1 hypothetical protein [Hoeflea sp.]